MKIVFCTSHPFPPEMTGGAQRSMQQLGRALAARGHEVRFLVGYGAIGRSGYVGRVKLKLSRSGFFTDFVDGFPVHRCWFVSETAASFVERFDPDVAVCFSGDPVPISRAFQKLKVPSVIYFRNVEHHDFGGDPKDAADLFIANSNYTAEHVKKNFNVDTITIPPLVDASLYRTTRGNSVTFINPQKEKGRDIAFALIKDLPEIDFLIVQAWMLDEEGEKKLATLRNECSNLAVLTPTDDMRSIYARTKIVLAPSQWQEAWGRIATEAHFSGIPVIASSIGGLSEAVGPGGVLVSPEAPLDVWKREIEKLWFDQQHYDDLANKAFEYSERDFINSDKILDKIESLLFSLVQFSITNRLEAKGVPCRT